MEEDKKEIEYKFIDAVRSGIVDNLIKVDFAKVKFEKEEKHYKKLAGIIISPKMCKIIIKNLTDTYEEYKKEKESDEK